MNNRMTFQKKIASVFILAICICLPLGLASFFKVQAVVESFSKVSAIQERVGIYEKLKHFLADFERGQRGFMLIGDESYLEPYSKAEEGFTQMARNAIEMNKENSESTRALQEVISLKDQWIKNSSIPQMMARRKLENGLIDSTEFVKVLKSFNDKEIFNRLYAIIEKLKNEEAVEYLTVVRNSRRQAIIANIFNILSNTVTILGLVFVLFLALSASKRIRNLILGLEGMHRGTLRLSRRIQKISEQLNEITSEQSTAMQVTSSAASELLATVDSNTDQIKKSSLITQGGTAAAAEGASTAQGLRTTLEQMKNSMSIEFKAVISGFHKVQEFSKRFDEIRAKTKLINDIVFQTKLLSFNASVEAARAGEYGRGFSVVAEEVGRLSKISGNSAGEIEATLEGASQELAVIISETSDTVKEFEKMLHGGVVEVLDASQFNIRSFENIKVVANEIIEAFKNISIASNEQLIGVREIEKNFHNLESINSQTVNAARMSKEIGFELHSTLDQTRDAISRLRTEFIGETAETTENENADLHPEDNAKLEAA